jgi:ferredoxin/flavodoxin---NADP+ reductase
VLRALRRADHGDRTTAIKTRSKTLSQTIGTATRPLRVAVIGAGPSAFYAVEALFKQRDLVCQVDMFNRLPTPFGLVREGVAPDHESIKAVTRVYERIAKSPNFRYFGNVTFGVDITHEDIKPLYDQIIYAVGAQSDRRMGIPGEDLEGSFPATAFVGWYNGHPDYSGLDFDLSQERVAVVGNGNVAMDVARILVRSTDELASTDIADHALERLRSSKVREVVVLGRRGPAQAAFTHPELKELEELDGVDVIVRPEELAAGAVSDTAAAADRNATKNLATLERLAGVSEHAQPRRIEMRFLLSPVEILGEGGKVTAVRVEKNELVPDGEGGVRARGTGEYETLEVGMVFRSIGYKGVALAGVPFNEKTGTIPNVAGRVVYAAGAVVTGEYVVGWAKRGPTGVIGTNKPDSAATVASMMEDLPSLPPIADRDRDPVLIEQLLERRGCEFVTYHDWSLLDRVELERGAAQQRPRVKFIAVPEMLSVIRRRDAGSGRAGAGFDG